MKRVGAHVSSAGGVENAPIKAADIRAQAFALFTKNQKQWQSKSLSEDNIRNFKQNCLKHNFYTEYILAHDSYLINLGNPDKDGLKKSRQAFVDEMNRCQQLGIKYLNFHPGSHKKQISESECLRIIGDSINIILDNTQDVVAVIENTAGMGGQLGYSFDHLAALIEMTEDKQRIGVCLDTCHLFVAGYDLRSREKYEQTMTDFDKTVGFYYLKGMHINDSKGDLSSRLDRHHSIGKGYLGIKPFSYIMNDPRMDEIPLILETIDSDIWKTEIKLLYNLIKNK